MIELTNMNLNYCDEKLGSAVLLMAQSKETLQGRLLSAMLTIHTLRDEDFSPDLVERWREIHRAATRINPSGDEGQFAATTAKMSDDEVRQLIEKIYMLGADVTTRSSRRV